MDAVKILGPNVNLSATPSSIGGANLVRIYSTSVAVITQTTSLEAGSVAIGNITVPAGSVTFLIKSFSDLLSSSAAVICTPVGYY